jgi:hypothetical protein
LEQEPRIIYDDAIRVVGPERSHPVRTRKKDVNKEGTFLQNAFLSTFTLLAPQEMAKYINLLALFASAYLSDPALFKQWINMRMSI